MKILVMKYKNNFWIICNTWKLFLIRNKIKFFFKFPWLKFYFTINNYIEFKKRTIFTKLEKVIKLLSFLKGAFKWDIKSRFPTNKKKRNAVKCHEYKRDDIITYLGTYDLNAILSNKFILDI